MKSSLLWHSSSSSLWPSKVSSSCRKPLAYYQTTAIAEGCTYQLSMETITDVDGGTANVTIRKDVPLQPPGEDYMLRDSTLSQRNSLFLREEVPYLGHTISALGIRPDPSKTEKVKTFPTPCDVTAFCQFIAWIDILLSSFRAQLCFSPAGTY